MPATTSQPYGLWLPAISLCKRELVRFLRQRNRIIGAFATPIVFWLLIGAGMGRSFSAPDAGGAAGYMEYFFPGSVVMILLFTSIFSTISIIEDRREGFLQGVLVAPVPRGAIVLGKVLGGTLLAFGQGVIFLALGLTVGIQFTPVSLLLTLGVMVLVSFALTALGFCIAWRMSSTQGFHAIMNLFLMPMWLLSGALFPPSGAVGGLKWVMLANPLTYGLAALRQTLYWTDRAAVASLPGLPVSLAVTVAFAVIMYMLAAAICEKRVSGDLH